MSHETPLPEIHITFQEGRIDLLVKKDLPGDPDRQILAVFGRDSQETISESDERKFSGISARTHERFIIPDTPASRDFLHGIGLPILSYGAPAGPDTEGEGALPFDWGPETTENPESWLRQVRQITHNLKQAIGRLHLIEEASCNAHHMDRVAYHLAALTSLLDVFEQQRRYGTGSPEPLALQVAALEEVVRAQQAALERENIERARLERTTGRRLRALEAGQERLVTAWNAFLPEDGTSVLSPRSPSP